MTLHWVAYEFKYEDQSAACGSTIYASETDDISYNDVEKLIEQIKKEVYEQNPMVTFMSEGPFITSIYKITPESNIFNAEEQSFMITYFAETTGKETLRQQVCLKVPLQFNNFEKTPSNLLTAFSLFLNKIKNGIEQMNHTKFNGFQIIYLQELH